MTTVLFHEYASPTDLELDCFDSGEKEVDSYFRKRKWFNSEKGKASPPTYVFLTEEGGAVVGYAAVSFGNAKHPDNQSTSKAKYLTIYAVGANQPFHGQRNPLAPHETFATSMFAILEGFAVSKADCVGLSLRVRSGNARAMSFYKKIGFVADSFGPVELDEGAPHLTMRKLLNP